MGFFLLLFFLQILRFKFFFYVLSFYDSFVIFVEFSFLLWIIFTVIEVTTNVTDVTTEQGLNTTLAFGQAILALFHVKMVLNLAL